MPYDACGMARITAQLSSFALACPNLTALWLVPLVTVIWPRLRFSRANWDGSNDGLNLKNLRSCKRTWLKYVKMEMNSNQLWFGHQFIDSSLNLRLTLISYAIPTKSSGPVDGEGYFRHLEPLPVQVDSRTHFSTLPRSHFLSSWAGVSVE